MFRKKGGKKKRLFFFCEYTTVVLNFIPQFHCACKCPPILRIYMCHILCLWCPISLNGLFWTQCSLKEVPLIFILKALTMSSFSVCLILPSRTTGFSTIWFLDIRKTLSLVVLLFIYRTTMIVIHKTTISGSLICIKFCFLVEEKIQINQPGYCRPLVQLLLTKLANL